MTEYFSSHRHSDSLFYSPKFHALELLRNLYEFLTKGEYFFLALSKHVKQ